MPFVEASQLGGLASTAPASRSAPNSGMNSPGLRERLDRIQSGDQNAAEELINEIYPLALKIVRGNLARRDAEEDVVQEIFIKIFSNLASYNGSAPFEHWVSRIAVNACMNRFRAQKARPEWRWADLSETQAEALETVAAGQSLSPDHELSAKDFVDHLLESLSPEDRLIIRSLEMEGLSVKEICAQTGWSGAFVRVRAFRARQKLNRQFSRLWKKGEL